MVGGVGDRSVTISRKTTQPDGGNGCYPRVRREHRQAVTFGVKDGTPSTVARAAGSCVVRSVQVVGRGTGGIGGDRSKVSLSYTSG